MSNNSTPADDDGMGMLNALWLALLAALAVLIVSLCNRADAAEAKIVAPRTAKAGEGILIDGTQAKSTNAIEWIVGSSDATVFRSADGRQLMVVSKEGYLFVGQKAIDADKSEDTAAVMIHVLGGGPTPPAPPRPSPTPEPPPSPPNPAPKPVVPVEPDPVIPTSEAGLASYNTASAVSHPDRRAQAAKVVQQMRRVQSEIKSGKINIKNPLSLRSGLQSIQKSNKELLGADGVQAWAPWGAWFGNFMYGLYMGSKLQTVEAWVAVIEEIIKGLEAVR